MQGFWMLKQVLHLPRVTIVFGVIKNHELNVQRGSNITGTNCDLFTHNQSLSYLNHLVLYYWYRTHENKNKSFSKTVIKKINLNL
jgi:hypothetical protein